VCVCLSAYVCVFSLVIFGRVLFLKEKQIDKDNCQVLFRFIMASKNNCLVKFCTGTPDCNPAFGSFLPRGRELSFSLSLNHCSNFFPPRECFHF